MDPARKKTVLGLLLHAALALAPGIAWALGLPDAHLYGVSPLDPAPPATWENWREGTVQAHLERTMEAHLGLRGVSIRTDNTLNELSGDAKPGSVVVHGEHGTLFIADDIHAYTRRPEDLPNLDRVRDLADLLADVQALLAQRGTPLVIVISPSKTSIYPEDVPARWRLRWPGTFELGPQPANALRERLTARGASFVDAAAVFHERIGHDDATRERLFSRPGRHWTPEGSCMIMQLALAPFEPRVPCNTWVAHASIGDSPDRDLLVLLNRWESKTVDDFVVPLKNPIESPRLRPLLAGSSFGWGMCDWLSLVSDGPARFFYYNRTVYETTPATKTLLGPVEPKTWQHYVDDRNLFIFEILESYVHGEYMREFLVALRDGAMTIPGTP